MRTFTAALIICLLVSTMGVFSAQADAPFTPYEDAIGYIFSADTPLNGVGLYADYTFNPGVGFGSAYLAYLKFDLNNLTGPVGDAVKIRLYTTYQAVSPFFLSIWSVDDGWDEDTLTWNIAQSHPAIAKLDTQVSPTSIGEYIDFTGLLLASYINNEFSDDPTKMASFIVKFENCTIGCNFDFVGFADSEDAAHPPLLEPAVPTAATLGSFSSNSGLWYNTLTWDTLQELNLQGFNLYRSEDYLGERTLLNAALLDAENSGSMDGFSYEYRDGSIQMGKSYFYWLELIPIDGLIELHESGPVNTPAWNFLPYLFR